MTGTTPQGRANAVRPTPAERANLIRTLAVAVVAQLALLAALAGCGLTIRGGYAAPTTRLPGAYPTYAPGPTPRPARPNQAALADAVSNSGPLFEEVFWIPKYPESERRDALPGWLHEYNHHWPHSAIDGKPPMGRLTHFPAQ
jgi:transposase InsO family protein